MPLSKKPKTPLEKKFDKKKNDVQDFWNAPSPLFLSFQKK